MAGWLVVWARNELPPDPARWESSLKSALRYSGSAVEHRRGRVALAAWHRDSGEFPQSGTIAENAGTQVAWVGQCVEDCGDTTTRAISLVSGEAFNDSLIAALNGPFAAAVIRHNPFEVRVITDRYRHYPVYVHLGSKVVVASTEMRCIVPWLDKVALDRDSVDMLLRCGELIDGMTMLEGVELLPPGTVLSDCGGGPYHRRYWTLRHDGSAAGTLDASAELLSGRLKTAVRRLDSVTPRLGITLSGGLDSRLILDLCERPERVPSFTWGLPGCRDITCASRFAALVQSPHTVKHWVLEEFPPLWPQGVDVTAGSFGIESMYMLPFVPLLASACDVVLNGLAGDVFLGGNFLKYSWLDAQDIKRLAPAVWRWRVSEDQDRLVDGLTQRRFGDSAAVERWAASIIAREGARPVERVNDWLFENRIFRYTNGGTMLLRTGVESHSPFWDRDFVDAVVGVRINHKFKHRLYLEVMKRAAPRAASVRWQRTNIKPALGYWANLTSMASHRIATKVGATVGIKPFKSLAVADPACWFRGAWKKSAEEIIIDDRTLQRGILNADAVSALWNAHQTGRDHTRQLGALIAIELFARQVIDGDSPLGQVSGERM